MKLIPKYQNGNEIARRDATYVAPRLNNPQRYKSPEEKARERQPHSEFVLVPPQTTIENGKIVTTPPRRVPNIGAGYLSGADPVGTFVLSTVAAGKPLAWLGKGLEYGAAKAGSQWARNRIVGREISKQSGNLAKPTYNKPSIPLEENRFYRVGSKEMGDDAVTSGVIRQRTNPKEQELLNSIKQRELAGEKVPLQEKLAVGSRSGNVPYFVRENLYMPPTKSDIVLVGNSRDIPFSQIGPKGRVNKYGLKPSTKEGQSATPYIDGEFNTANANNFQMFKHDPEFGWTRHQLAGESTKEQVKAAADFGKAQSNYNVMNQMDKFADKYGYPKANRKTILSNRKTNKQAREVIARHNTYMRGVEPYGFESGDVINAKKVIGDKMTTEDFLKYAATNKRNPDQGIWISPGENAFIYGGRGETAYVRRPYKLGSDRSKWFKEGDFSIQPGTKGEITAPWYSPQYGAAQPESELISNTNLNFAGWANSNRFKHRVSLNNKVR